MTGLGPLRRRRPQPRLRVLYVNDTEVERARETMRVIEKTIGAKDPGENLSFASNSQF
jgi:hypothetical protein